VVLLNDSTTDSARVKMGALHGALASAPAQLERLSAPSVSATSGITIGGRSFGASTTTATLRPAVPDPLTPRGGGYQIDVPARSAVTLTFTARSRRRTPQ
jgi:hypothetical protein